MTAYKFKIFSQLFTAEPFRDVLTIYFLATTHQKPTSYGLLDSFE